MHLYILLRPCIYARLGFLITKNHQLVVVAGHMSFLFPRRKRRASTRLKTYAYTRPPASQGMMPDFQKRQGGIDLRMVTPVELQIDPNDTQNMTAEEQREYIQNLYNEQVILCGLWYLDAGMLLSVCRVQSRRSIYHHSFDCRRNTSARGQQNSSKNRRTRLPCTKNKWCSEFLVSTCPCPAHACV